MSPQQLLSKLDRLGVELHTDGERLRYAGSEEVLTPDLLSEMKVNKSGLLDLLTWDDTEAYVLVKGTLAYLNEQHRQAGKPNFDPSALHDAGDRIDGAFVAEDMGALRHALKVYVFAGIKELYRHQQP